MTSEFEIRPQGYTIIGKYGCYFLEAALKLIERAKARGVELDYVHHIFFETIYENLIKRLKTERIGSPMQLHDVIYYYLY